jgi:hypothetical protein
VRVDATVVRGGELRSVGVVPGELADVTSSGP